MYNIIKEKGAISLILIVGIIIGLFIATACDWSPSSNAKGITKAENSKPPKELQDLKMLSRSFIYVAKETTPAIVNISTTQTISMNRDNGGNGGNNELFEFFGDDFLEKFFNMPKEWEQNAMGSGVIVSEEGYILTNNHVIKNADEIKVKLQDEREFDAIVIGTDEKSDLAVIKIDGKDLPIAKLGNSDNLEVGEWVIAIGNPFGLNETVTAGIVSAKGRSGVGIADYEDFIQTDAAINPGNSGGALVNLDSEVIGINTAIATRSGSFMGIGFAIPINMAQKVMLDLIEHGEVVRGWLGVAIQEVDNDIAEQFGLEDRQGVLISGFVGENSPAKKAGMKIGDVIVKYDDIEVIDTAHLRNLVASTVVDEKIPIVIIREGKNKTIKVKIDEQPSDEVLAEAFIYNDGNDSENLDGIDKILGLRVRSIDDELMKRYGLTKTAGIVVTLVEKDSPIDNANISVGDVILEINRKAINNMKDYKKEIDTIEEGDNVLMLIEHNNFTQFVVVKIPQK